MGTQATSYRKRLNALLFDVHFRGEYVKGHGTSIDEDGNSLSIDEATSDEEHDNRPSTPRGIDDIIEVAVSLRVPGLMLPSILPILVRYSFSFTLPHFLKIFVVFHSFFLADII